MVKAPYVLVKPIGIRELKDEPSMTGYFALQRFYENLSLEDRMKSSAQQIWDALNMDLELDMERMKQYEERCKQTSRPLINDLTQEVEDT